MNSFRSMGCEIVVPYGVPLGEVQQLFAARDARFSRFHATSELNSVNAAPLGLTLCSEDFASMLSLSLDAARATDGLITPCVGDAIISAGYDCDFVQLPQDVGAAGPAEVPPWTAVSVRGRGVLRTAPVRFDLNGVVKGKTVDDALAMIGRGWISAGGDIAAKEPVVVGLPAGGSITLHSGGLATSSVGTRRWLAAGRPMHHLIDPRTGRPTDSPWLHVSVAAGSCLAADVAAKAALLLQDEGPAWLDARSLAGRFVDRDRNVVLNQSWTSQAPLSAAA